MALVWMHGFEGVVANAGTALPPMTYGTAPTFNTTYGRFGSTGISNNGSLQIMGPRIAKITMGMAVYFYASPGVVPNSYICYFIGDYNATGHINIYRAVNGAIEVRRGGAPGTLIASSAPGVTQQNAWYYLEVQTEISDTVGKVIVRLNEQEIINFTGDTRNAGTDTTIDQIAIYGSSSVYYDDIYVLDGTGTSLNDFLGDVRISTIYPDSNGTYSQGLGSDSNSTDNYLLVNEAVPSAANYVDLGVGEKDTYGYQNISLGTPSTIYAIKQSSYLQKTSSGAIGAKNIVKLGATEVATTAIAPTSSPSYFETFWTEKPGGGAWTESDLNSAEFGVEAS